MNTQKYSPIETTNSVGCSPHQVSILQSAMHLSWQIIELWFKKKCGYKSSNVSKTCTEICQKSRKISWIKVNFYFLAHFADLSRSALCTKVSVVK